MILQSSTKIHPGAALHFGQKKKLFLKPQSNVWLFNTHFKEIKMQTSSVSLGNFKTPTWYVTLFLLAPCDHVDHICETALSDVVES